VYDVKWAQQDPIWESLTDVKATSSSQLLFETNQLSPNLLQQLVRWNQTAPTSEYGDAYRRAGQLRAEGAKPTDAKVATLLRDIEKLKPAKGVGYGPYVVDPRSVTAQQLTMVRNPGGYNSDKIKFDHVDVVWGSTQQTVPLLLRNQLDYTTDALTPTDVRAVKANPNIELIRTALSTGTGIWFNEAKKPFDDKRFREAIAYIVDRQRNATVSLGDAAKPIRYMAGFSDNYVPDWLSSDIVGNLNTYQRDDAKATQLLEQVGLTKSGDHWTYNGGSFGFEIIAPTDFPDFLASAKDVSAQLNEFGFNTHVRGIPAANRPDTIKQGRYDVMLDFSMVSAPAHPATSLDWNMAAGFFGTNDPESKGSKGLDWPWHQTAPDGTQVYIPDLLRKAVAGVDKEPQRASVETLAQIFNDQLPVVPLFERYTTDPIAHGPRVTGWLPASDPIYKNNQANDPYASIQFLEGVLRPAKGGDGSFITSGLYAQPPNYSWNYFNGDSFLLAMPSPSYDLMMPPLFWYSQAIHAYIPSVGKSYSVARVG
jgi:peptide/nickel transport system substrate-binding protein